MKDQITVVERKEYLLRTLVCKCRMEQKELNSFKQRLDENPVYAFSWSLEAMDAAVKIQEFELLLKQLKKENGRSLHEIKSYYIDGLIRMSQYVSRSTSQPSNIIEENKKVAYSIIIELIDSVLR